MSITVLKKLTRGRNLRRESLLGKVGKKETTHQISFSAPGREKPSPLLDLLELGKMGTAGRFSAELKAILCLALNLTMKYRLGVHLVTIPSVFLCSALTKGTVYAERLDKTRKKALLAIVALGNSTKNGSQQGSSLLTCP